MIVPEAEATIWRYMPIERYKSLLNDGLYMRRANCFEDKFEGSLPKIESDNRILEEKRAAAFYNQDYNETQALENARALAKLQENIRGDNVVSCWHMNPYESNAMWKLYLENQPGVAIKSTVKKLIQSLSEVEKELFISKVRYLDYENGYWYDQDNYPILKQNLFTPLVHKRKEFEHEKEVRVIYQVDEAYNKDDFWSSRRNPLDKGLFMPINVGVLVDELVVSIGVNIEDVEYLNKRHGYSFKVRESVLNSTPLF